MSRTIVRVKPCYSFISDALVRYQIWACDPRALRHCRIYRRDHRAYSAVPPTRHGNTDPIFPFPSPLTRTNAANILR